MRIPLGWLTDRTGGRRVFTALMAFYTVCRCRARALARLAGRDPRPRLPARLRRRVVRGRRAVRQRLVPARAPGLRARHLRHGHGRHGARRADRPEDRRRSGGWRRRSGSRPGCSWSRAASWFALARDAERQPRGQAPRLACSPRCRCSAAGSGRAWALTLFYFLAFGGFVAMFLYLPKLLTGVHDLTKADAGARAAGFALLAVIGRPTRRLAVGPHRRDRVCCSYSSSRVTVLALVLAAAYKSMVPLTIACLTMAVALGLGMGAVFKLVPEWFPDRVGAVTGVVGAAGGLGGFFPPLVMGDRQVRHRRLRARLRADGGRRGRRASPCSRPPIRAAGGRRAPPHERRAVARRPLAPCAGDGALRRRAAVPRRRGHPGAAFERPARGSCARSPGASAGRRRRPSAC